ncbi:hypothetical protein ANCDUO_00363 [Ancylostoma duodenale]|uniref:Uncharacterized protein n=1 Tax=Ancylostoma duodenale TaxID=51022 RepID=A0A0C2H607_9BILA|nr:hypothetical protein ANCDUO_00363 [Ancylostoma duodenale]
MPEEKTCQKMGVNYAVPYEIHSIIQQVGTRQPPLFGQEIYPGAKLPPPGAPVAGTPPSPPQNPSPPPPPKAADVHQGKVQRQPPAQLVPFAAGPPGVPFQPTTPVFPYAPGADAAPLGRAQLTPAAIPKPAVVRAHSAPAFVRESPQFQGNVVPTPAAPPPPPATSPAPGPTLEAASHAPGRTPLVARSAPDEGRARVSEKSMPRVDFVPPVEYVDVSSVFIRFVQFLILCELSYYLCRLSVSFEHAYVFAEYM